MYVIIINLQEIKRSKQKRQSSLYYTIETNFNRLHQNQAPSTHPRAHKYKYKNKYIQSPTMLPMKTPKTPTNRHPHSHPHNQLHTPHESLQLNTSIIVLKYIEPARQLLESTNTTNSVYRKQLNPLPYIFKNCDRLHPLAKGPGDGDDFVYEPEGMAMVYERDLALRINPFQAKGYFRSTNMEFRGKIQRDTVRQQRRQLQFDSHFESGNLLSVRKTPSTPTYHLLMQNDINTFGCTQWFFFRTLNQQPHRATFYINNFYKPDSLYRKGMKILIFSMKKFVDGGVGWVRGGEEISYFGNKITERKEGGKVKQFYTLKFVYTYEYEDDQVYFAYNYPYTYSKLNTCLSNIPSMVSKNIMYNCRTLCKTAAENKVFMVTITSKNIAKVRKNSIFLTSRVHPGETVSSLMMEGIIEFLTSEHEIAQQLREKFIFKLVPMLNPDGVIHGNYRTNLAGIDLNRVWDVADRHLSPQIYQLKKYIIQFNKESPVTMFCDLHGHSARKSAFIYGCQNQKLKMIELDEQSRLFPFMLSYLNEDFLYNSCNFKIQKSKKGTARIQLWKQLKIPNIFTLQASFCSSENSEYHFRPTDYSEIGVSFCKTIHEYFLNEGKRKEFYEKLKLIKDASGSKRNDSDQDSESDNDLFDGKTISELKNGAPVENLWTKRKMTIERPQTIQTQDLKPQQSAPRHRRYTMQRTQKTIKTQASPCKQLNTAIITIASKRTITSSIPTKRLTLETDILKYVQPKGSLKRSIFERVEHNYRGKSTVYRIQRKNVGKMPNVDGYRKHSSIFDMDNSLDLY